MWKKVLVWLLVLCNLVSVSLCAFFLPKYRTMKYMESTYSSSVLVGIYHVQRDLVRLIDEKNADLASGLMIQNGKVSVRLNVLRYLMQGDTDDLERMLAAYDQILTAIQRYGYSPEAEALLVELKGYFDCFVDYDFQGTHEPGYGIDLEEKLLDFNLETLGWEFYKFEDKVGGLSDDP